MAKFCRNEIKLVWELIEKFGEIEEKIFAVRKFGKFSDSRNEINRWNESRQNNWLELGWTQKSARESESKSIFDSPTSADGRDTRISNNFSSVSSINELKYFIDRSVEPWKNIPNRPIFIEIGCSIVQEIGIFWSFGIFSGRKISGKVEKFKNR